MATKFDGKRWLYAFDYENRLARASNLKRTVRYRYDALGRRVQRHIVGDVENTKFTYDGDDVLLDDNFGTLTKYLNGEGIDNKLRQTTGSNTSYFLADHLGSTNGLANGTGALVASTHYDSFGNPTNLNFPTRYQFTGREYDKLTGLHFYRARFYDSNLGRFISEDPIGFRGGDINLYGYVKNNPLRFRDPLGLQTNPAYPICVAGWTAVGGTVGFGAGGGFGALAGPGGVLTIPLGAYVGAGVGGLAGTALGSLACGTPPTVMSSPTEIDEACPTGKVLPFPSPRPTPQTTPTPPPPDRITRCNIAYMDCLASSGGDPRMKARCALSLATCVNNPNVPVIFPNGVWVY